MIRLCTVNDKFSIKYHVIEYLIKISLNYIILYYGYFYSVDECWALMTWTKGLSPWVKALKKYYIIEDKVKILKI